MAGEAANTAPANHRVRIPRRSVENLAELPTVLATRLGDEPLRWCIAEVTDDDLVLEVTSCSIRSAQTKCPREIEASGESIVVNLVPTGIGCSIGGFAGDAAPATALLAAVCDHVVVNPNAVNASNFINLPRNALYTEGYLIDQWLLGCVELFQPRANRVGLVIEQCEPTVLDMIYRIVDTVRAVHGIDVVGCSVTAEPIGTVCVRNPSGAYVGTVENPAELLRCTEQLLDQGATAIAVTSKIRGLDGDSYAAHFHGEAPNPVGGAEAVLSHLVARTLQVPCAHAPIVNFRDFFLASSPDPRGAGELASESGLACVLVGLRQAPQMRHEWGGPALARRDVRAVVAPATALGGPAVISAEAQRIPIVAVEDNHTLLKVTAGALGLGGVIDASSYAEAVGLAVAITNEITVESVRRPLSSAYSWS